MTPTTETAAPAPEDQVALPSRLEPAALAAAALTPLATPHREAWAALARAHAALTDRVQAALTEAGLPPYQWYELLAVLEAGPEGRLVMRDLAEALIMTRGGLTRLFDRLEGAGLVSRAVCPTDRRSFHGVIEKPGRALLAEMRPVVTHEIEATFVERISAEEAETIATALDRARAGACAGQLLE